MRPSGLAAELTPFAGRRLAGVLRVLNAALPADPIPRSLFVRKVLLDPNFDPEGAPVALSDGKVVGFALAVVRRVPLEDAPIEAGKGYITLLAVDPAVERSGVGSTVLAAAERHLRERGCEQALISPYAPGYFTPGVDVEAYRSALEFLARRGYAEVYRPIAMDCDLLRLRRPDWVGPMEEDLRVKGVAISSYEPAVTSDLMRFLRERFPGDWQRFARAAIDRIEQGDAHTRLWTASRRGEVLAMSHHEGERYGPIGVHPDWRGQGIGQALLYRTLEAMRARGLHNAWFMWSDDRTAARLYTPAGFTVSRRFAVLRKELHD